MISTSRLLTVAHKRGAEAYLMVLLGGDAGLGLGGIVALEWHDIDLAARRLTVQRSDWRGHVTVLKGGRSRQLPMTQQLTAALKAARHLRSERVLCLSNGCPITRDRVIKAVRGAQRVAGIEQGVHILRHAFCSHLATIRARTRAAIWGHSGHAFRLRGCAATARQVAALRAPAGKFSNRFVVGAELTMIVSC